MSCESTAEDCTCKKNTKKIVAELIFRCWMNIGMLQCYFSEHIQMIQFWFIKLLESIEQETHF